MKYAFFADVHGNLEALNAVRKDMEQLSIDKMFFLGDAVGYGPNPNEVVALIDEMAGVKLAGNHDWAALGKLDYTWFSDDARDAIFWTIKQLTEQTRTTLEQFELKHSLIEEDILLVHSTPKSPEKWHYIMYTFEAEYALEHCTEQVLLIAHSHVPVVFRKGPDDRAPQDILSKDFLKREDGYRYVINTGSVGQPRDRDPSSCYLLYDTVSKEFSYRRVVYDISATQEKMRRLGLLERLVLRLAVGR